MLSMGNGLRVTPVALMVAMIFSLAHISTAVATGTNWTATGSMNNARHRHSAVMLANGKVLIVGGTPTGASAPLASAELYDPAAGTWATTGSMSNPRWAHTTTLLANGKVLVTGGGHNFAVRNAAELYDPATGTWTATAPMNQYRYYHIATLLANGKVLVAAGAGTYSAELYDPATGTWTFTGFMTQYRDAFETATLLANGKVLLAGGSFNGSYVANAELYDPATGTWAATGSMTNGRYSHTATLLANGKVLVVGGNATGGIQHASTELYDPATGTWASTGSLIKGRSAHTATLLANGKVLVAGGYGLAFLGSGELYDPATGAWAAIGSMASGRLDHTATLLANEKVLVAGGYGIAGIFTPLASAELYGALDAIAPTASPARSPAANGAGWNNSDVTVTWNWADNAGGSGIDTANCTTSSVSSGEGSLPLSATCKDVAGNTGNASSTVKVDKTNPAVTAGATKSDSTAYTAGTWTNQTVTVHYTCSDSGSGVASCPANQVLSADGVTSPVSGTATDNADNSAVASFGPIQIDKTNPLLTPPPAVTVNPTAASGAVVSNVTLGMPTVSDNLTPSPVWTTVSGLPSGNLFPIGTTTLSYTATDLAGNSTVATQAVTVRSVNTLLAQLIVSVNGLPGISNGLRTSLLNYVENTQDHKGNLSSACAQMAAFINRVSAEESISPAQKASLIADAIAVRSVLGCT